jgi:cytochrome c oxidase subunit 2
MIEYFVPAASTFARDIDFVFDLIFWCVLPFFLAAEAALFWFAWRFRTRRSAAAQYIAGEDKREKRWITIPHNFILVFDVIIVIFAVRVWYDVKQHLPEADQTVRIVAQQWAWSFVHPGPDGRIDTDDDIRTVDDLHVKVDTTYHFKLEARDVLHSFSIPAFRLKQDAIPGRVITGWFTPTQTGTFDLQCAEICGIGHGIMGARVTVETAEQHAAWVASHATPQLAGGAATTTVAAAGAGQ